MHLVHKNMYYYLCSVWLACTPADPSRLRGDGGDGNKHECDTNIILVLFVPLPNLMLYSL